MTRDIILFGEEHLFTFWNGLNSHPCRMRKRATIPGEENGLIRVHVKPLGQVHDSLHPDILKKDTVV